MLEAITYGAIVTRLLAPARNGSLADVALGFDTLGPYVADRACFGAIVGRVAGRITGARFQLGGKTYELAQNEAPNHLHGGTKGFNKRNWTAVPVDRPDGAPSLRLSYRSPDGEEGYPGNLDVAVTYTITADNVFLMETEAMTDRPTPFSLTQHSYFNLAGEASGVVAEHELQIYAGKFVPVDERMTLLDRICPVREGDNDFRRPRVLGEAMRRLSQGNGDLYVLQEPAGGRPLSQLSPAARLVHPGSGRVLDVSTTATHLQFYTGAWLDGSSTGKGGRNYTRHSGICLECEGYPNGANAPDMGDILLHPGGLYRESTAYAFGLS